MTSKSCLKAYSHVWILTLTGLLLRLYGLKDESLWLDESVSAEVSMLSIHELFDFAISRDVHPPLYYIILHYWVLFFGNSEVALRLPSVVFSTGSIPIFYFFSKNVFNQRIAGIATTLLVCSPIYIYYAQEARTYSFFIFCTLGSLYFLHLILIRKKIALSTVTAYILFTCAFLYQHVYGIFFFAAQLTFIGISFSFSNFSLKTKQLRLLIIAFLVIFIIYSPWIGILITQVNKVNSGYWIQEPEFRNLISSLFQLSISKEAVLLLFVVWQGHNFILKRKTWQTLKHYGHLWPLQILLISLWFILPVSLSFIISKVTTPIFLLRPLLPVSLAAYLFIALIIDSIDHKYWVKRITFSVLLLLFLAKVMVEYNTATKENWRGAAAWIMEQHTDRTILIHANFCKIPLEYYLKKEMSIIGLPIRNSSDLLSERTAIINDIKALNPVSEKRVLFITSHQKQTTPWLLEQFYNQHYSCVDSIVFDGITIFELNTTN